MNRKHWWFFIAVIGLAALLRLYRLSQSPASLYWEEVALGYDAFSILTTGKDHHGWFSPIVAFESYGDWKPSGYFYVLIPFVRIFGLKEMSVRLPSVLAGIGTVVLVYFVARQLFERPRIALWSAFCLAILPWHIQFSRAGFEVNVATFWLTLGILALLRGKKQPGWLFLGAISMAASMYTYHGLRALAPLMIGLLVVVNFKLYKRFILFWVSLGCGIVMMLPLIQSWSSVRVQQRIAETSLFSVSSAVERANQERVEDGNTWLSRLIHHRYWYLAEEIVGGMVSHFNPNFLFINGDGNPRHQTGEFALLYPWMMIPFGVGIIALDRKKGSLVIVGWVILATVPAALTKVTPHTLRFLPAAPGLVMVMGLGMEQLTAWLGKQKKARWLYSFLVGLVSLTLLVYTYDLWWIYPKRSSQEWQYGYRELAETLKPYINENQRIFVTNNYGRAAMFLLFYLKIEPDYVWKNAVFERGEIVSMANLDFGKGNLPSYDILVVEKPYHAGRLLDQINFLDGQPAFYIYEN